MRPARSHSARVDGVTQDCPCHVCSTSEKGNLDFLFPSELEGFMLTVAVRCGTTRCPLRTAAFG